MTEQQVAGQLPDNFQGKPARYSCRSGSTKPRSGRLTVAKLGAMLKAFAFIWRQPA